MELIENNNYHEIVLKVPFELEDEITAILMFQDFEGFIRENEDLTVYKQNFNPELLDEILQPFDGLKIISITKVENQNWNEIWEQSYESVSVGGYCHIYPKFRNPKTGFRYYIKIDPQMSFGTGHHETTQMMVEFTEKIDFTGKKTLDMGCGTGILGILASKLGSLDVVLIDYDPICRENAIQNCRENEITNAKILIGSKEAIPNEKFDIIFANINRNVLLEHSSVYTQLQNSGGKLLISGFFDFDTPNITSTFESLGYEIQDRKDINNWQALLFQKL